MLVNADCTLYMVDGSTYRRIPVSGVHWENTRGANLSKTGSTAVDAIAVHIPFSSPSLPMFLTQPHMVDGDLYSSM